MAGVDGAPRRALVVDDDAAFTAAVSDFLQQHGFEPVVASTAAQARERLDEQRYGLCLVDLLLPDASGAELLEDIAVDGGPRVIVMTAHPSIDRVVSSLRARVFDFLVKPVDLDRLAACLDLGRDRPPAASVAADDDGERSWRDFLLGDSAAMHELGELIERVAPTDTIVTVEGESGTGKELIAQAIHELSDRRTGPFVAMNCGALPEALASSELFGHERGSFTGANRRHRGVFERASDGTLLLDEVSEMPPDLQVHLLRVLETGRFRRVGGSDELVSRARIVAATNRPLHDAVRDGRFREDLYFRLTVFPLQVPPLAARGADIELLAGHFLALLNERDGVEPVSFDDAALAALRQHPWTGNVRELRNAVHRARLLARDARIDTDVVEQSLSVFPAHGTDSLSMRVGMSIRDAERRLIEATLESYEGDKRAAAQTLGISLKTLYNRLNAFQQTDGG